MLARVDAACPSRAHVIDEPTTLAGVVRRHGKLSPGDDALSFAGRRIDYGWLDQRSNQVANAMRADGVSRGDRVAYLGKNAPEFFAFLFGAAKLNATAVPINWRLAPPEIAAILADAGARLLVVSQEFEPVTAAAEVDLAGVRVVTLGAGAGQLSFDAWLDAQVGDDPGVDSNPEDIALLLYTSGTTGHSKGVMISNSALIALLRRLTNVARFERRSVNLCSIPMFHIGGSAWVLTGLWNGCTTVLVADASPADILAAIERERVTVAIAVPALIQMLVAAAGEDRRAYPSLRTLYYGGGPITDTVLRGALEVFGCDFVQGFGLTECAIMTALGPEHHDPERRPDLLRSCGRVLPETELRLVDPDTGEDVPIGSVGEIWVRSPIRMSGYHEKPVETAAAITPDGWLRTGDAARVDADGFYYIADRIKDMIISGGENVYSAEVENVLMAHPAIAECAVIGVPSARWGETVKAVVALAPGATASEPEMIAFCRERLARYKCPTSVQVVAQLPRTPSGKVVKHQLRAVYAGRSAAGGSGPPLDQVVGSRPRRSPGGRDAVRSCHLRHRREHSP